MSFLIGLLIVVGLLLMSNNSKIKKEVPNMQDKNLDQVRYVQVHFFDWNKREPLDLEWEVSPKPRPGHYEYFIDSSILIELMLQKQSISLYDGAHQIIPMAGYDYSWNEMKFGEDDGGAILNIYY